jgi:hypothetical protein
MKNKMGKPEGLYCELYGYFPAHKLESHPFIAGNLETCEDSGTILIKITNSNEMTKINRT